MAPMEEKSNFIAKKIAISGGACSFYSSFYHPPRLSLWVQQVEEEKKRHEDVLRFEAAEKIPQMFCLLVQRITLSFWFPCHSIVKARIRKRVVYMVPKPVKVVRHAFIGYNLLDFYGCKKTGGSDARKQFLNIYFPKMVT